MKTEIGILSNKAHYCILNFKLVYNSFISGI